MMLQPGRRAGLTWFGAALALALACGAALLAWQHGGAARGPSEQLGGAQAFGLSTAAGDSPNALAQMQADSGRFAEDRLAGMVRRLKKRMASLNDMREAWSSKVSEFKLDERRLLRDLGDSSRVIHRDKVDFEHFISSPGPVGAPGPMGAAGYPGVAGDPGPAGGMGFYGRSGGKGPTGAMGAAGRC